MTMQTTVGFGIRVDGHDLGMTFATLHDAEDSADRLFVNGYKRAEIFRRTSSHEIVRLGPSSEVA